MRMTLSSRQRIIGGFSLVESIIAVAIFVSFSMTLYTGYSRVVGALNYERYKSTAAQTANEQFELARNLSYADVGIQGGLPAGKLKATQQLVRNGMTLIATTTVRSVDDPFDGQVGSTTNNDLSPADYKLVDVLITCVSCVRSSPLSFTSTVAPKGLETSGNNGALFVKAFDAGGLPIQDANVHITNATSSITIDDVTNAQGMLQIVDAPPGVNAYSITVTKSGYSVDKTYSVTSTTTNPVKPPSTVATQTVTAISFAIDKVSSLGVVSQTSACGAVGGIDFTLAGGKIISTSPDVLKYPTKSLVTDGSGLLTVNNLEWDTYAMNFIDGGYDLAGSIPLVPFFLSPNTTQNLFLIVAPKNPNSLMITVKDSATGNTITDATTTLSRGVFTSTKYTGRGTQAQSDWAGGSGQMSATDLTRYFSQDGNIETSSPTGELKLLNSFGAYVPSGNIVSSSFDTGASSNFRQLLWTPGSQAASTTVRMQVATALTDTASTTWTFKGPDGTSGTYYDVSGQDISSAHNGDRYLRYKVFLDTASSTITPLVSDVSFSSTSSCIPPGQVFFSGLTSVGGNYTLDVTKDGYTAFSDTGVAATSSWREIIVTMVPI